MTALDCPRRTEPQASSSHGGKIGVETFPWLHTYMGDVRRMIPGAYHRVSPHHLHRYLATIVYRANRRWREDKLFNGLVVAAIAAKPLTFKDFTTGGR